MATVFVSMAMRLSDLDDQKSGINIQTEGHTLTPPSGWNCPEDQEAFGSTLSHSPSQSLARKPAPDLPETQYCLEIQATSTKDEGVTPPPPHMWQAPIVERHGLRWQSWPNRSHSDQPRSGHPVLQVAIIRRRAELGWGVRHHIHIFRSHQLGWQTSPTQCQTGKPRWWLVVDCPSHHQRHIEPRGPGYTHSIPPASTPFNFYNQDSSPWPANFPAAAEWWEVCRLGHQSVHQSVVGCHSEAKIEAGAMRVMGSPTLVAFTLIRSWIQKWPKFSINFLISVINVWEIGSIQALTPWLMALQGTRGHMKINLPVFKDEDAKDTITY